MVIFCAFLREREYQHEIDRSLFWLCSELFAYGMKLVDRLSDRNPFRAEFFLTKKNAVAEQREAEATNPARFVRSFRSKIAEEIF